MKSRWSALLISLMLLIGGLTALAQQNGPVLQQRPPQSQSPDQTQAPYPEPAARPNVVPEGTTFLITLDDKIDTKKVVVGKHFKARLGEDLIAPNGATIPRGKEIIGHVSDFTRGFRGRLLLSFDRVNTDHGWVPLVATVTGVPGEHGVKTNTNNEGEIERRGPDKRRAIEAAAIGAAAGAATGGAVAGGHGAIIGAVAGGGAGAAAGLLTDRDMHLDKGTNLEVRLDRDLQVPMH